MSGNKDWQGTTPWDTGSSGSGWSSQQTGGWGATEQKGSQASGWGDIGWGAVDNNQSTPNTQSTPVTQNTQNSMPNHSLPTNGWEQTGSLTPTGGSRNTNMRLRDKSKAVNVQVDSIQFGKGKVQVGKAQELQCNKMQARRGFLSAWFQSLIYGVPFYMGDTRNTFNLYPLEEDGNSMDLARQHCVMVTFFGPTDSGMISSGQIMEVHGSFGPDRSFYASNIINRTNGTSVRVSAGLPGNAIRVITLLLVGFLVYLFSGLNLGGGGGGSTGGGAGIGSWLSSLTIGGYSLTKLLLLAALLIGLLAFCIHKLKHPSMQMRQIMGEIGFFLVVVLALWLLPELGSLLLIIWLIKLFFPKNL